MTKRINPCKTCKPVEPVGSGSITIIDYSRTVDLPASANRSTIKRGFTRHADGVCSKCRAEARQAV